MKKGEPMKAGEDKAGKDFMPVLMENYEAMKMAKAGNMKDVLTSGDPFDCILETYDDLIFLYKKYQPVVNTVGNWKECRCDNPNHYCFVHHQWGKLSESVSGEGKEAVEHLLSVDKDKEIEKLFNLAEHRRKVIDKQIIELGKQDAEIERLKGLLEKEFKKDWTAHPDDIEEYWKGFLNENNL